MTRRQDIVDLLYKQKLSAQQLTNHFRCELWEIVEDLKHIGRSLYPDLKRTHPYCNHCGFTFKERSKIKSPSRCPDCKRHNIIAAKFYIEKKE